MKVKGSECVLGKMEPEAVIQAAEILRTLAHPIRLRIVDLLHTEDALPVSEITAYLGITQSATSQHLTHMRRIGLLKTERRGKEVWYSIADPRPIALLNCICNCCKKTDE